MNVIINHSSLFQKQSFRSHCQGKVATCAFMTFLMSPAVKSSYWRVRFHWNFGSITLRPNKNDSGFFAQQTAVFPCVYNSSYQKVARWHEWKSLYHNPSVYKEHIWLQSIDTSNFTTASALQTTRIGQSIPFGVLEVPRQWHLHFLLFLLEIHFMRYLRFAFILLCFCWHSLTGSL